MRAGLLAIALLALLSGCAVAPTAATPDMRTASDMTDVDRIAKLHMELAAGYFGRGQASTALDEIKKVIAARPDLPEAYNLRGLIYASLAEPQRAEESFRQALKLDPRDANAMNSLGVFLCQERRYDEAAIQFDRAIAQPGYRDVPTTLLAKGWCQARAGQLKEADSTLSRSFEMDPTNPATSFHLGEVLFQLGEFERARFYLRRVNSQPATANAQTLWLAARVEHRLGNGAGARSLGEQLQDRFPQSPEAIRYERGRFDE